MTFWPRTILPVCAAALAGCAGNQPHPRIDAVDPAQAHTDQTIRLVLTGADFVPSFRIDPVSGERVATMDGFSGRIGDDPSWESLTDFGWVGPTQISASLAQDDAEDLANQDAVKANAGYCDLEITDPRGTKAVPLRAGFLLLPPNTTAPVLTINSPDPNDPYAPGGTIHGDVVATIPPPGHMTGLTWTYSEPGLGEANGRRQVGHCPLLLGESEIHCTFDVTIDKNLPPGTPVYLEITASDDALPPYNQTAPARISITLGPRPTVSSVTPASGGIAGGTNVVIQGSGFVVGSRVYFGTSLLVPDGGTVVDEHTITGYTPSNPAGATAVTMQSRLGFASWASQFQYQLPPHIGSIVPPYGTQNQDTHVRVFGTNFNKNTIVFFGQNLASAVRLVDAWLVDPGEIDGVVPGASGSAPVWAFDADNGSTCLSYSFVWNAP